MRDIHIGDPVFQRNLLLFPIYGGNGKNGNYERIRTIEEAEREGFGRFEEFESADVSKIIFRNSGNYPVFAIDGEEVVGALQNRVINTSFFSEPNTIIEVPVSCVEEGRWKGDKSFTASGIALYPSLRAILLKTTNKNLSKYKTYLSEQRIVWESVRSTLSFLRVSSKTLSIHDAFKGYESQIEWYLENLDFGEARGLIAFAGSKFICMDLFISSSLFKKFMPKILRGYALDALLLRDNPTDLIKLKEAKSVIDKIMRIEMKKYPAVGKGIEFRGEGEGIITRGLKEEENKEFLHLAVFPDLKI